MMGILTCASPFLSNFTLPFMSLGSMLHTAVTDANTYGAYIIDIFAVIIAVWGIVQFFKALSALKNNQPSGKLWGIAIGALFLSAIIYGKFGTFRQQIGQGTGDFVDKAIKGEHYEKPSS